MLSNRFTDFTKIKLKLNAKEPFESGWRTNTKIHYKTIDYKQHNAGILCGLINNIIILDVDDKEDKKKKNDGSKKGKKNDPKGQEQKNSPYALAVPPHESQQTNDINYKRGETITVLHVAEKPSIAQVSRV